MPENPGIPPLFRDIFNNAYLPYRDPETLRAFLKVIDEFSYDHSERLGDAFEYLLLVLGSQGAAGQFRTPRHIIDFIVAVLDPKKDDVVLDPACGTAGFLISSYKYIMASNSGEDGHSTLTPHERGRLADNFRGYDISPDMVRLSLVNMYLHGFAAPHIFEYDTLTSEDRWNEYADVILANPAVHVAEGRHPSPQPLLGQVQAQRSPVRGLHGGAPNSCMAAQGSLSQKASSFRVRTLTSSYEKCWWKNYLVAVVSLPAGVFNPYSGVKTSILILGQDAWPRSADSIAFFKDGQVTASIFGAQRRPVEQGRPAPGAGRSLLNTLTANAERTRNTADDFTVEVWGCWSTKERISADGDYNLSARAVYRKIRCYTVHRLPLVALGDPNARPSGQWRTPPVKSDIRQLFKEIGRFPWITLIDQSQGGFVTEISRHGGPTMNRALDYGTRRQE